MARGGMPIYCVGVERSHPPLAIGMVLASAQHQLEKGAFRFVRGVHPTAKSLARAIHDDGPGIVLFSDYIWCTRENLALSAEIKRAHPSCVMVHGGPDIPKDPAQSSALLEEHRHIDIAVCGEGEKTFADLLGALGEKKQLDVVDGLIFRRDGALVKTNPRERVQNLDTLPSAYLSGLFDHGEHSTWRAAILETNRGCPYGCTFCDWGSATLQKVRNFSLDRVEAEIEWIARRKIAIVFVADANFGILPRDVQIAEQLARAKSRYGYPQQIVVNYAKNATERVAEIIRIFVGAKMTAEGIISLQTTDPATLEAIDRKNIKTSRYEQLIEIFRREKLPLSTDFLLGLPQQTVASIKRDLQFAFDWALAVKFYQARMLVNSPMARPEYVQLHGLRTDRRGYVMSTKTMDEKEGERGRRLCFAFQAFVETGMLKYLFYYLQEEYQLPAIDVLEEIAADLDTHPDLKATKQFYDSLYSFGPLNLGQLRYRTRTLRTRWEKVYREVKKYLFARHPAIRDDSALDAVLSAQAALMPRFARVLPARVNLRHDVVAYFSELGVGQRRFVDRTRPRISLREYPPGILEITDPDRTCWSIPETRMTYDSHHLPFELGSALRLEKVQNKFLRKRDVLVLKLERSRAGRAFSKARELIAFAR